MSSTIPRSRPSTTSSTPIAAIHARLLIATEFGAARVLDLGCGTGTLAITLAARGFDVTAVDPAGAVSSTNPCRASRRVVRGFMATPRRCRHSPRGRSRDDDRKRSSGNRGGRGMAGYTHLRGCARCARARRPFCLRDARAVGASLDALTAATSRTSSSLLGTQSWEEVTKVQWPNPGHVRHHHRLCGRLARRRQVDALAFGNKLRWQAGLLAAGFVLDDVRDAPDSPWSRARVRRARVNGTRHAARRPSSILI